MSATQHEAATHLGLSIKNLRLILMKLGFPTRGIDLDQVRLAYIHYLQEAAAGRNSDSQKKMNDQRAELYRQQSRKAQMEADQLEGTLVPIDVMAKQLEEAVTAARAKLLSLPTKLAPKLVNKQKTVDVQAMLKDAIYEALNELAEGVSDKPEPRKVKRSSNAKRPRKASTKSR